MTNWIQFGRDIILLHETVQRLVSNVERVADKLEDHQERVIRLEERLENSTGNLELAANAAAATAARDAALSAYGQIIERVIDLEKRLDGYQREGFNLKRFKSDSSPTEE